MIKREAETTLQILANGYPVIAITGPRQSGKTTLAKHVFKKKPYVSLEDPDELEFSLDDPKGFLARFPNGAVIDEVQKNPKLFSYIQTIVDTNKIMGMFILTGSQHFGLLSHITQSLAGRVGFIQLLPFSITELLKSGKIAGINKFEDLLIQGFYPPVYDRNLDAKYWYPNYVITYLERDVRQIINVKELNQFQRFIRMCAARAGQVLNLSALGNDCGISHNTARSWISVLEASYIVFLLQPHYSNYGKRLIKSPKLYFYDSGLAAWLMNIQDADHLSIHPARGALFENFVISELYKDRYNQGLIPNIYFWRDSSGVEIDVIIEKGEMLVPVEIKSSQTVTEDFFKNLAKWTRLSGSKSKSYIIYGGNESYTRHGVHILSWKDCHKIEN